MSLIRGTALDGFPALVAELGVDAEQLLRGVRLDPAAVGRHDRFLEYRGVIAALEAAARATGCGDLGRRLARRQGLEILGPLGVAARTAPTVASALASIETYMSVYSPAIAIAVTPSAEEGRARFVWRIIADRPPAHRQAAELALGVTCEVFRLLAGPDFAPVQVRLRHHALTDPHEYEEYFGAPVEFAAPAYGFTFDAAVLARPLGADSAVHAIVEAYLDTVALPDATSTVESVRRLIHSMLPTGALDLGLVSAQLAMHPRTLQRHLARQGTSYAELVDQVRREVAEHHLLETAMPLGQLAGVLGLSEQSALTRACRRWFGESPTRVRARAVGARP